MRFRHISDDKVTEWVPVSIPARDMHDLLSSFDRIRYLDFEVHLHFEITPTREGEVFEYAGEWALPPAGNYPGRVLDAIEKYLSRIRVEEVFGDALRRRQNL